MSSYSGTSETDSTKSYTVNVGSVSSNQSSQSFSESNNFEDSIKIANKKTSEFISS